MNWFKKNKNKVIIGAVIAAVLVFAFWYGGDAPGLKGWSVNDKQSQQVDVEKNDDNRTASSGSEDKTDKQDKSDESVTDGSENVSKDSEEASKKAAEEAEAKKKASEEALKKAEEASKAAEEAKKKTEQAKTAEEKKQAEEALKKAEAEKKAAEEAAKKAEAEKKAAEEAAKKAEAEKKAAEEAEAKKKADEEASKKAEEDKKKDEPKQEIDPKTGKDKYQTDPVPEGKPIPVEPQDQEQTGETLYCTFSISCASILNNMEYLNPEKEQCVPSDGWILAPQTVAFTEGENVYQVLAQVCIDNGIHMESSFTPMYNSVYIEGINNLYEFDCGQMSGWMYKVNGWFPNYGASRYVLKNGDVCCWVYTCDLGNDVGGGYAMGN